MFLLAARSRQVLLDLVKANREEYHNLSDAERKRIIKEFSDFKEMKIIGICASTQSKVNDVTQTFKLIGDKLNNLKARTGVETMLYATHGTTDLPLRGVAFATEGVQDFMGSLIGVEMQDLVSKMEGFAVQGIQGAAKNHQQHVCHVRANICEVINVNLRESLPFHPMKTLMIVPL
ncbi:hypothetical protein PAXRUDRAFT_20165 [Paxillus rubicundulus Ve08.2h10]|uniref:Uncharacterized protein n=1 Tax=Paxillus rubicundulus Ve08.2h10 TaxID=930991 RepID=A0A0D0CT12_9AGAM|nr:hypothetical protein PAXRUDRAFT_20165 [Paxillus rubicundulus Ve08.2h10]